MWLKIDLWSQVMPITTAIKTLEALKKLSPRCIFFIEEVREKPHHSRQYWLQRLRSSNLQFLYRISSVNDSTINDFLYDDSMTETWFSKIEDMGYSNIRQYLGLKPYNARSVFKVLMGYYLYFHYECWRGKSLQEEKPLVHSSAEILEKACKTKIPHALIENCRLVRRSLREHEAKGSIISEEMIHSIALLAFDMKEYGTPGMMEASSLFVEIGNYLSSIHTHPLIVEEGYSLQKFSPKMFDRESRICLDLAEALELDSRSEIITNYIYYGEGLTLGHPSFVSWDQLRSERFRGNNFLMSDIEYIHKRFREELIVYRSDDNHPYSRIGIG